MGFIKLTPSSIWASPTTHHEDLFPSSLVSVGAARAAQAVFGYFSFDSGSICEGEENIWPDGARQAETTTPDQRKVMNCAHKVLDKMSVRAFSTGMMEGVSMGQLLRSFYEPQDLIVKTSTQSHKVSAILVFRDFTSDPGNNNYILTPFRGNFPPYGRYFATQKATARCTNGKKHNPNFRIF
ncbi:unnamed protein product [Lactuca saligna]|uniref:Uncharacterized protein n=1 Tax=Lactuca saligna TaxID=75948 RepID=A0AA35V1U7_LACSI|nr:unnamed protein product [Lactuca saligna]